MSGLTPSAAPVSMRRYGLQLVATMIALAVICIAASMMFRFQLPSAMGIIILIASMTVPANRFAVRERREMTSGEKARLGLWAALGSVIPVVVLVIGVLLWFDLPVTIQNASMALFGDMALPPDALLIVMAVGVVLTFLVTYFSAGFMTRGQLKALSQQDARKRG